MIYLVHGFNIRDAGTNTIDRLVPVLYDVDNTTFDYGWYGLLSVRFRNKEVVDKLLEIVTEEDVVVGHSNGCAIIAEAINKGLRARRAIFIHPALDKQWEPKVGSAVEKITVFYSKHDLATRLSRFLIHHIWGEMGTVGPISENLKFVAIDDGMAHSEGFYKCLDLYAETIRNEYLEVIYAPGKN